MVNRISKEDWTILEDLIASSKVSPMTWAVGTPSPLSTSPIPQSEWRKEVVHELVQDGYWVKATGSRVTQDGWTDSSDWDYVVFDPDLSANTKLLNGGWTDTGSDVSERSFSSLRYHDVNLIIVKEEDQWKKWIIATNLIKALNSKTKEERIKVFDSVFGVDPNAKAVMF